MPTSPSPSLACICKTPFSSRPAPSATRGRWPATIDFAKLGGVIPKTVTRLPRIGNAPPRTVETPSGMLNAIGLDNDGIDHFIAHHLPYLRTLPTAIIANIAGKTADEFVEMAAKIGREPGLAGLGAEFVVSERFRRARFRDRSDCHAANH